jgi:hypothetical protein
LDLLVTFAGQGIDLVPAQEYIAAQQPNSTKQKSIFFIFSKMLFYNNKNSPPHLKPIKFHLFKTPLFFGPKNYPGLLKK